MALTTKNIAENKNTILILSLKKISLNFIVVMVFDNNKNIEDRENADGNKNKPKQNI